MRSRIRISIGSIRLLISLVIYWFKRFVLTVYLLSCVERMSWMTVYYYYIPTTFLLGEQGAEEADDQLDY